MDKARRVGRYEMFSEFGAGGMATIYLGRLVAREGFSRIVAVKELRPDYARDPEFVAMLLDEARVSGKIQHPNVVPTLDIVSEAGELFVVMDYVHGVSLWRLIHLARKARAPIPIRIAVSIVANVLRGLHAAHETSDEGKSLDIVHRDVSPQNILVGQDGIARLIDFGVAKAAGQHHVTRGGEIKGKIAYMAPEHLKGRATKQSDVFAAAVVLWEALSGKRRSAEASDGTSCALEPPTLEREDVESLTDEQLGEIDRIVMKGLSPDLSERFATAKEMADALDAAAPPASVTETGDWVSALAHEDLDARAGLVSAVEEYRAPESAEANVEKAAPQRARLLLALALCLSVLCWLVLRGKRARDVPLAEESPTPHVTTADPSPSNASPGSSAISTAAPPPRGDVRRAPGGRPLIGPLRPRTHPACDPPYNLDEGGRKIFKEECLR